MQKKYPHRYPEQVIPEAAVPGIADVLGRFHHGMFDLQRRFLRIIAVGLDADEDFFERLVDPSTTLSRAIHYPAMDLAPGVGAGPSSGVCSVFRN